MRTALITTSTLLLCLFSLALSEPVTNSGDVAIFHTIINNYPAWAQIGRWSLTTDPCIAPGWSGVTCDEISGEYRVTGIVLPHYNSPFILKLAGPIPQEIGLFPELMVLNLFFNNLTGTLPPFVSTKILSIELGRNLLTGPIPASYLNQQNISRISLHSNKIEGPLPAFTNCAPAFVTLSGNKFNGSITNLQMDMKKLMRFTVSFNQLSGSIPSDYFENAPILEQLSLAANEFEGSIPQSIAKLPSLSYLDLGNNKFSGNLPTFENPFLSTIYANDNQITGSIPSFKKAPMLTTLVLACNQLTGSIPESLSKDVKLQYLRVEVNNLTGSLPLFLQSQPQLILFEGMGNEVKIYTDFNATCNFFQNPLPKWCSELQGNNCVPCSVEERICKTSLYASIPTGGAVSPLPEPSTATRVAYSTISMVISHLQSYFQSL